MEQPLINCVLFTSVGLLAIIISIANWDFFFNSKTIGNTFLSVLGRKGMRVVYLLVGVVIITKEVMMITSRGI
ncbi:immunity 17 family protein [Wenyingzhuangia sp. 2_MG-2023]|uniref:immunity 17 family protein n=1 Tax=Wenyingzhuangia sp. 2_MG-2023 TaxID=3062639 RepID=UPI0026E4240D|nr:immunity 17 family protein [Wenyingzhuangia sp. 2_MG-2023]MDO6737210.1 immunity 17 family protein [Wenyingzhuangia sp. 2_MG-2023]MDO6801712.1 immunity 17 family protein [Wenyingzhuangia sp. 1_MG-2023]